MSISRTWMVPAVLGCGLVFAGAAVALTGVPAAQPKSPGVSLPNILARGLAERVVARGSMRLENGTAAVPRYGYDGDGPLLPAPGDLPSPTHLVEATKTEPDKNTYLVLRGQRGADRSYAYGTHFLFQGHEAGVPGYITRVNLDANAAHRVTLLATTEATGAPLPPFDGSTWDPWAKRLLFTSEAATQGGVWQATAQFPSTVRALAGSLGNAGYEGIQNDPAGDLWIVEDVGGAFGTTNAHAKQPNSFLYRFVPAHPSDLTAGRLQVLQVMSRETGRPIVFHPGQADADITSPDTRDLNSYGMSFHTSWVTIHDAATDGTAPFDANALAKAAGGTPFKRPENGQFRPGSHFRQFFFDETGDTDLTSEAGAKYGGFGGIFELTQAHPAADRGVLRLFYRGDPAHTGLDNVGWISRNQVVFVEDAGDTVHTQRGTFDSAFVFDTRIDYGRPSAPAPVRLLALGRDPSATIDSGFLGMTGFQNEGDNEITGFHVSNGDPTRRGILGASVPTLFRDGWRMFYTQQHGENRTFQIVRAR